MVQERTFQRDRVLILANPNAGFSSGRAKLRELCELLDEANLHAEVFDSPEELTAVTEKQMAAGRLRSVVAAGGDGTAELVANCTPPGTPIAILPLGTENLLAKYLRLKTAREVAVAIRDAATVQMDAGKMHDRLFLLMVSCGFDAEVIRRLDEERSGHIHHLSYAKPIVDSIRSYQYPKLRVYCRPEDATSEGNEVSFEAHWVFVFNVPSYAIGLAILPGADPFDGLLDVCAFRGGSFWHGLMHFSAVVLGQHRSVVGFRELRARWIRIESDEKVPFQLDGEAGGFLPIEIEILPKRLTYVVAKDWKREIDVNSSRQIESTNGRV